MDKDYLQEGFCHSQTLGQSKLPSPRRSCHQVHGSLQRQKLESRRLSLTLTTRFSLPPLLFCSSTTPLTVVVQGDILIKLLFFSKTWFPTLKCKKPRGRLRLVTVTLCESLLATGALQILSKREKNNQATEMFSSLDKRYQNPRLKSLSSHLVDSSHSYRN